MMVMVPAMDLGLDKEGACVDDDEVAAVDLDRRDAAHSERARS
jgi:hypothetical protein